jgi:phosphoribosylformylglycinamidine cyclo-ligase
MKRRGHRPSSYRRAGVDIDAMDRALKAAKETIRSTTTPGVVSDVGSFGGLHVSPGSASLLVSSIDGVGTKLAVAKLTGVHNTIGRDLVNHCVNDILTQGARPLFFLDYLGTSTLDPSLFAEVIKGLAAGCRENGCALIGGETAEMPGLYPVGEYDLVGAIVGAVARDAVITGEKIKPGDVLIGLPSSGLHTNGYSLARKVLFKTAGLRVTSILPGTRRRVGRILLDVHRSYLKPVTALRKHVKVRGLAHITGGGLIDNVPRILPRKCSAVIDCATWTVPKVFQFIQKAGRIDPEEMYRVFNMGIGMVVVVRKRDATLALETLGLAGESPHLIGEVKSGPRGVTFHRPRKAKRIAKK